VHLNRRNPELLDDLKGKRVSVSCHSIEEILQWKEKTDYCFLSPVFDSISKQGYRSGFSLSELNRLFNEGVLDERVCALSGITFGNIPQLEAVGFTSFALLSSLWELPRAMFITHYNDRYDYVSGTAAVLEGGLRFVQLRMKDADDREVLAAAEQLRPLCDRHSALLTVDDRIHLLETGLFDGVHVGKHDMPVAEARKITDGKFLLGATCNTAEDVIAATAAGADYIGLGPFRFTGTKKNLSPILGVEGYQRILSGRGEGAVPVYAIGGITPVDLPALRAAGVYGVAVSGVLLNAADVKRECGRILVEVLGEEDVVKQYI
jgi:thiamine-phosphate pyrophosphorylase